jgi:HlyD family secretion protein
VKLLNVQAKRASVERMIRDTLDTISVAEQKVKEANYYAPMGGIVSEVLINPKQISGSFEIKPGQIIARIDKPGRYKVKAHAIDTQAKKIMAGTKAVVSFESNNVQFEGNIASVQQSPLLQTDKLPVFNVGVVFDSNGATIPRGLLTRVVVVVTSKVNAIAVPWQAISVTPNGNFVTQLDLKKRKKLVPVELGIQGEDRVEVKDGLNEGDIVYTHVW